MNVRELIAKLGEFDQELPVVTAGFDELGVEFIGKIKVVRVVFADVPTGMWGEHVLVEDWDGSLGPPLGEAVEAVWIDR